MVSCLPINSQVQQDQSFQQLTAVPGALHLVPCRFAPLSIVWYRRSFAKNSLVAKMPPSLHRCTLPDDRPDPAGFSIPGYDFPPAHPEAIPPRRSCSSWPFWPRNTNGRLCPHWQTQARQCPDPTPRRRFVTNIPLVHPHNKSLALPAHLLANQFLLPWPAPGCAPGS